MTTKEATGDNPPIVTATRVNPKAAEERAYTENGCDDENSSETPDTTPIATSTRVS